MENYIVYTKSEAADIVEDLLAIDYNKADKYETYKGEQTFEETLSKQLDPEKDNSITVQIEGLSITFEKFPGDPPYYSLTHFYGKKVKIRGCDKDGINIPAGLYERVLNAQRTRASRDPGPDAEIKLYQILRHQKHGKCDEIRMLAALRAIDFSKADYIIKVTDLDDLDTLDAMSYFVCFKGAVLRFFGYFFDDSHEDGEIYLAAVNNDFVCNRLEGGGQLRLPWETRELLEKAYLEKKSVALEHDMVEELERLKNESMKKE